MVRVRLLFFLILLFSAPPVPTVHPLLHPQPSPAVLCLLPVFAPSARFSLASLAKARAKATSEHLSGGPAVGCPTGPLPPSGSLLTFPAGSLLEPVVPLLLPSVAPVRLSAPSSTGLRVPLYPPTGPLPQTKTSIARPPLRHLPPGYLVARPEGRLPAVPPAERRLVLAAYRSEHCQHD